MNLVLGHFRLPLVSSTRLHIIIRGHKVLLQRLAVKWDLARQLPLPYCDSDDRQRRASPSACWYGQIALCGYEARPYLLLLGWTLILGSLRRRGSSRQSEQSNDQHTASAGSSAGSSPSDSESVLLLESTSSSRLSSEYSLTPRKGRFGPLGLSAMKMSDLKAAPALGTVVLAKQLERISRENRWASKLRTVANSQC